jgi:hypothetical protein
MFHTTAMLLIFKHAKMHVIKICGQVYDLFLFQILYA